VRHRLAGGAESGTWVREAVSIEAFRPAVMRLRLSSNRRPSRRTRKSVRPADGRVSDRTVVRPRATRALAHVQFGTGVSEGERGCRTNKPSRELRRGRRISAQLRGPG